MEFFCENMMAKSLDGKKPWTVFAKSSFLDVRLSSYYVSTSFPGTFYILLGKEIL